MLVEGEQYVKPGLMQKFTERAREQKAVQNDYSPEDIRIAAAELAHEIANELTVVDGAVEVLETELAEHCAQDATVMASLQHVKSGIKRLSSLLDEFRSLARPQSLSRRPTHLVSVVNELVANEEVRYAAQGIRVEIDFSPDLPSLMLDEPKFRQALLNLCRNAAEAMPRGGTLKLRGYRTHSNVHLEVVDTGAGIPPGLDPFALFKTTKPTGTGLGLPIVRQIVSRHGGMVSYASEPGTGTIFRLTLPLDTDSV